MFKPRFQITPEIATSLLQIEGNRLTLPEVKAALNGAKFPGRKRDETEVRNHFLAFAEMENLADAATPLQEKEIQQQYGQQFKSGDGQHCWHQRQ